MIILEHHIDPKNNQAQLDEENLSLSSGATINQVFDLAHRYPDQWICWTNQPRTQESWNDLLDNAKVPFTALSKGKAPQFLTNDIDYVEDSPFIDFKSQQWYPTWIMSADQGMIHASVLQDSLPQYQSVNWEYDLNVLTRTLQSQGLLCYSYLSHVAVQNNKTHIYSFVKKTSKKRWLFFLLLCHIIYEKNFPLRSFLKAFFHKAFTYVPDIKKVQETAVEKSVQKEYDVIIPTMGRTSYLKDVLLDLSKQTILPQQVIIVEQDEDPNSSSELNYLNTEEWPFKIHHEFIHQSGACNARNLAIEKTSSEWVLLFDDDNRYDATLMERVFNTLSRNQAKVLNMAYLQKGEIELQKTVKQWPYFGSGCSIVHRDVVEKCKFDMALEHGYGEDVDYGMQIRNVGYDVIYAPQIQILHLKAPIGGFRKRFEFPWETESVQPKPSPQIIYYRKKNYSNHQLLGYKMVQFFKTYGSFKTKLPWTHYKRYINAWNQSEKWANQL